jgi:hypoxanthine phosphoribosyltransferase
MPLKLILMSPDGTIAADGKARTDILRDLCTFIGRMAQRQVQVALWSRTLRILDGEPLEAYLSRESNAPVRQFQAGTAEYPTRQRGGSVDPILAETGIRRHETILVGSYDTDMQAAVNNRLLLLRPAWYGNEMPYGFPVNSISELAQFCEIFALRQHPIYWSINSGSLQVRSMGPFSTFFQELAEYGADARKVAKENRGDPNFWFYAVVSALYFSGILHEVDYICTFPGHDPSATGGFRALFDPVMSQFGKCFRKTYFPDLIVRHTKSLKSQHLKANERTFLNHLNTMHLNPKPRSYNSSTPRKTRLSLAGKRILVIDDFITAGRSLDVARAFIEAAGATATLFSWLKTVNTNLYHMLPDPPLAPYQPCTISQEPTMRAYSYHGHIIASKAPEELNRILDAYKEWKWP